MNNQNNCQIVPHEFPPNCPVNSNTFPGKLWKLVNSTFYKSICWTNNGTSIGIDALKFKHEVLKCEKFVIFKTKNFSSFVRQLNLYGFRKLTAVHPSSRLCEFSENHMHTHPHLQLDSDLQHFQHNFFNRGHPELLIRVRRASAAQKRKAQENRHLNTHSHGPASGCHNLYHHGLGILRDGTNRHNPYHHHQPGMPGPPPPFPVSLLRANQGSAQGKIFGMSLIASTSRGSLIATPPSGQQDFSRLCNQQGQLKKFVVIGRQDAAGSLFLGNNNLLSPTPPVLHAYMSPTGNQNASLGYALMEAPLDTSCDEAESAVAYLMNETFDSSPSLSPHPSPLQQQSSPLREMFPSAMYQSSSSSQYQLSDDIDSPTCASSASSSHLSAPSASAFFSATSSSSSAFGYSSDFSSSSSSTSFPSSSSYSPGTFSTSTSSGQSTFSSSLGSSGSDNLFPSLLQGSNIISSAFESATQEPMQSMSLPNLDLSHRMSPESSMFAERQVPMDHEERLATPLPPSPIDFAQGLNRNGASSTPANAGPALNCRCPGRGSSTSGQSAPQFNVENIKPDPC